MEQTKSKPTKYFTENHVNVTKRINDGITHLVLGTDQKHRKEAKQFAEKNKSYIYDVYTRDKDNKLQKVGFAIPK